MARQLTQTLSKSLSHHLNHRPTPLFSLSSTSFFATKPRLVELDVHHSPSGDVDIEVVGGGGLQILDDAIHSIIVHRLAPDWLPFRPGSSYWVPPRQPLADNFVQLVNKLANPLTREESLSLTSSRGFPSSSYFLPSQHQGSMSMVKVHVVKRKLDEAPLSEDEE